MKIGDKFTTIERNDNGMVVYHGTIIQITDRLITGRILVDQRTVTNNMCFGPAKPYNRSYNRTKQELERFSFKLEE